jgi:hypothetical protein
MYRPLLTCPTVCRYCCLCFAFFIYTLSFCLVCCSYCLWRLCGEIPPCCGRPACIPLVARLVMCEQWLPCLLCFVEYWAALYGWDGWVRCQCQYQVFTAQCGHWKSSGGAQVGYWHKIFQYCSVDDWAWNCGTYIAIVNFRQEYDVREERRRELEFLEKVSLQVILQIGFSCSSGLIAPFFCRVATH